MISFYTWGQNLALITVEAPQKLLQGPYGLHVSGEQVHVLFERQVCRAGGNSCPTVEYLVTGLQQDYRGLPTW